MKFGLNLKLSYFSAGLRADLDRIITQGDSAGMFHTKYHENFMPVKEQG